MSGKLNIAILGAGAMGSFYGALLALKDQNVTLLDVNDAQIAAINEDGVFVDLNGKHMHTKSLKAIRPEQLDFDPDIIIVFTKNYVTEAALNGIKHRIGEKTILVGLQNGLGNDENLLKFAPPEKIIIGMTTWPAAMGGIGKVVVDGIGLSHIQTLDRKPTEFAHKLAELMDEAGLHTKYDENVWGAIWEKVAYNASMNAACALTGCTFGTLKKIEAGRKLVHDTVRETLSVATALGIETNVDHCIELVDFGMEHHFGHKSSMLQDVEAGRKTEVLSINGKVADYADKCGVKAPINRTLTTLVLLKSE